MVKLSKQIFLVWLLSLTLVSVQLIQFSPIHDHGTDVTNCALCHFDFNEFIASDKNINFSFEKNPPSRIDLKNLLLTPSLYYPYQERSPPTSLS